MLYGELKRKIRNLGFAEEADMTDFEENTVSDAINQAIADISKTYPVEDYIEFTIDEDTNGIVYVDIRDLGDNFIDFAQTPVFVEVNGSVTYTKFTDYDIEMGHTLVIDADAHKGKFRIYYQRQHIQFTDDSSDDEELELPLKAQYLVPLLGAYYLWLEDNPTLASSYNDKYQVELNSLINEENNKPKIRARVTDGGI